MMMMLNLMIARKTRKITQKELADKVGISNLCISRYENGITVPKADVLQRLADVLGVSMEFLMEDTKEGFDVSQRNTSNN